MGWPPLKLGAILPTCPPAPNELAGIPGTVGAVTSGAMGGGALMIGIAAGMRATRCVGSGWDTAGIRATRCVGSGWDTAGIRATRCVGGGWDAAGGRATRCVRGGWDAAVGRATAGAAG